MPNIESISNVYYLPENPYHFHFDNLPLRQIVLRQQLVNHYVDLNSDELSDARGDTVNLNTRLSVCLEDDGSFRSTEVPIHSIDLIEDSASYLRMTVAERAKLDNIMPDATALRILVEGFPIDYEFDEHHVRFSNSSTVYWEVVSDDTPPSHSIVRAHAPARLAHYYGATPSTSDHQTYVLGIPIRNDSLRVYVNGIRVFSDALVNVPRPTPADGWDAIEYSVDESIAEFTFNIALTAQHIVRVDFDRSIDLPVPVPTPTPTP